MENTANSDEKQDPTAANLSETHAPPKDLKTFFTIWSGQTLSVLGSGLTQFALVIWIYQETNSVTQLALLSFSMSLPGILLTPIAGAIADRWDRRRLMLASDLVAGVGTAVLLLLYLNDLLQVWHVYVTIGLYSVANAFQIPAYIAATTLLVPKDQLGRISGLMQMGPALAQLLSPLLGGVLLVTVGMGWVFVIDLVTFAAAVITLVIVRIPMPKARAEEQEDSKSLYKEAAEGWHYLLRKPGLFLLMSYFALFNFLLGLVIVLPTPLILGFSNEAAVGTLGSVAGVGMLVGTILMSTWGGPKRRIHGVLGFGILAGLFIAVVGLQPSLILIGVGGFGFMFCMPLVGGCSQAFWQTKVEPQIQGRVFALRRLVAQISQPLAFLAAGPTADLFEAWMTEDGRLADSVGLVLGTGEGRGVAVVFVIAGLVTSCISILGFSMSKFRNLDTLLPDALPDEPETVSEAEELSES